VYSFFTVLVKICWLWICFWSFSSER